MLAIILCVNRMTTFVSVSSYRMVAPSLEGNHDDLADAKYQAELFRLVYTLSESKKHSLE